MTFANAPCRRTHMYLRRAAEERRVRAPLRYLCGTRFKGAPCLVPGAEGTCRYGTAASHHGPRVAGGRLSSAGILLKTWATAWLTAKPSPPGTQAPQRNPVPPRSCWGSDEVRVFCAPQRFFPSPCSPRSVSQTRAQEPQRRRRVKAGIIGLVAREADMVLNA